MKQMNRPALAALLLSLLLICTACGKQENPAELTPQEPEQPQISQPEAPTEEVPPAEPVPQMPSPASDSLAQLRRDMEPSGAIAGILYLGYWDQGPLNSDFFATLDPQAYLGRFAFLAEMPEERLIANEGYEIYCIIPADPQASVTVEQWNQAAGEDLTFEPGAVLYDRSSGEPFLVQANVSDLFSNLAITIEDSYGNCLDHYQPFLSLQDGRVGLPAEDQPLVLDYTLYEQDPDAFSYGFELYLPNESADGLYCQWTETQLLDEFFVLQMLVEQRVLPDTVTVNSFSQEGEALVLDLSGDFADYLNTQGSTGELLTLGALVNSYLSAFEADSLSLTVEGAPLSTGHNVYDAPLTWIQVVG